MIPLSLESIYEYLTSKGLTVQKQPETKQLYILSTVHDQEYPLFIRIMDESELLQLLAFMPISLDAKTVPEVARLLHLFNKEIDIPGFGMDEASSVCFYRIVLPAIESQVPSDIVNGYINSIHIIAETFFPVIAAVSTGTATFNDVIKKANETITP